MLAPSIYRELQKIGKIIFSLEANNLIPGSSSNGLKYDYSQLLFIFLLTELDINKKKCQELILSSQLEVLCFAATSTSFYGTRFSHTIINWYF